MFRRAYVYFLASAAICASTVLASAQVTSSQTEIQNSSTAPVAFVYVANARTSTTNEITGYSVASNGTLTPISGSPFHFNVTYMALTGHWLFGIANTFEDIDSFAIGSNGALSLKDKLTVVTNGDGLLADYLDHTGSTLYADLYSTNNDFLSYTIDHSTGQIMQIGDLSGGPSDGGAVSFIGNNVFAYSSSCYHFSPEIVGVRRNSNGTFAYLDSFNPPFPTEKSGGFYCPSMAAADPTNHLAIALQPLTSYLTADGPWQLATYTADGDGNLSTHSTYTNMPKVLVGMVSSYRMSPSGRLLAVGGSSGLEVFHFNGTNPITKYTGRLTTSAIDQVFWDNSNHLYAISRSAGKLYLFTVTPTSVTQAPGSPHSISKPQNLIVLPST
ncbi:MAG TPA: hypothetical protein VJQ54_06345 [Candidatus Sulfotelmatobacter sp.]|nr:hypothetical protein [Candidatus Sulfotelmatobacter sp.]